jgi:hypothetical protein
MHSMQVTLHGVPARNQKFAEQQLPILLQEAYTHASDDETFPGSGFVSQYGCKYRQLQAVGAGAYAEVWFLQTQSEQSCHESS